MLIPCIDLQSGRAVQLVHGRKRRLAVDDVLGLLDRFGSYGVIHVIDLDAAMRKGSNARLVRQLCEAAGRDPASIRRRGLMQLHSLVFLLPTGHPPPVAAIVPATSVLMREDRAEGYNRSRPFRAYNRFPARRAGAPVFRFGWQHFVLHG